MKLILIGYTGDIGQAALTELSPRHDIIRASRSRGDIKVDISDRHSIRQMYREAGKIDAVVCTAGNVHFGDVNDVTHEQFMIGLNDKVMGQINVVLEGLHYVNDGGSFTLTSGVLDRDPIRGGAAAATANGAIGGFVLGASIELPRGIRLNAVSPGLLDVSEGRYGRFFPGHERVASARVGLAYTKSVERPSTGKVIIVQ